MLTILSIFYHLINKVYLVSFIYYLNKWVLKNLCPSFRDFQFYWSGECLSFIPAFSSSFPSYSSIAPNHLFYICSSTCGFQFFWSEECLSYLNSVFFNPSFIHLQFYVSLGLRVGGIHDFADSTDKPWKNRSPKGMLNFWNSRDKWFPSWYDANLKVDYVRVYAL